MHAYRHWLPVALWMVVIFEMSSDLGSAAHTSSIIEPLVFWIKPTATQEEFELLHFIIRKLAHLTEYAVLALLVFRALKRTLRPPLSKFPWQTAGITLLIAATYAATDEWHQSFVPGRTPAIEDVLIDSTGAFLSLLIILSWCQYVSPRLLSKAVSRSSGSV